MRNLERKVNLLIHLALAEDDASRQEVMETLRTMETSETPEQTTEEAIEALLQELGVPCNLKGYNCIILAVSAAVEDMSLCYEITGRLYPIVAEIDGCTWQQAERNIRHAIDVAWDRGDADARTRYFGKTVSESRGRPTNGEFINRVVREIKKIQRK